MRLTAYRGFESLPLRSPSVNRLCGSVSGYAFDNVEGEGGLVKIRLISGAALLLALGAIGIASPMTATACGCGSWNGPTLAKGVSEGGTKWRIWLVKHGRRNFTVEWGYLASGTRGPLNYSNGDVDGFGASIGPLPAGRLPALLAVPGSGLGDSEESGVSGFASWRTRHLVITMKSGERLKFRPVAAPLPVRKRFPWIKAYRFFDRFFDGKLDPVRITALNRSGKVIGRQGI